VNLPRWTRRPSCCWWRTRRWGRLYAFADGRREGHGGAAKWSPHHRRLRPGPCQRVLSPGRQNRWPWRGPGGSPYRVEGEMSWIEGSVRLAVHLEASCACPETPVRRSGMENERGVRVCSQAWRTAMHRRGCGLPAKGAGVHRRAGSAGLQGAGTPAVCRAIPRGGAAAIRTARRRRSSTRRRGRPGPPVRHGSAPGCGRGPWRSRRPCRRVRRRRWACRPASPR